MKIVVALTLLVSLCAITTVSALSCNGMQGLCDLTLDKVTFPGAHNAGAGFNGDLHFDWGWWGSPVAPRCSFKNVDRNFYSMLDNGVRFFDIDIACMAINWSHVTAIQKHMEMSCDTQR